MMSPFAEDKVPRWIANTTICLTTLIISLLEVIAVDILSKLFPEPKHFTEVGIISTEHHGHRTAQSVKTVSITSSMAKTQCAMTAPSVNVNRFHTIVATSVHPDSTKMR